MCTRKNFIDSDELYIPEVYWDLTTSRVMVLEKIEGIPCTDIKEIEKHGIDKKILADLLEESPPIVKSMVKQLSYRLAQCDAEIRSLKQKM